MNFREVLGHVPTAVVVVAGVVGEELCRRLVVPGADRSAAAGSAA